MSSDLVQTGFFDLEEVRNSEPIQVNYDYSRVTPEQADKLQTIYNRTFMRHLKTEYEDGKDLLEAQNVKDLPYEEFMKWVHDCYGLSEPLARRKMNRAQYWGDFTVPGTVIIQDHAIDTLSTKRVPESARQEAKALLTAGISIDEETAKELRDKHKALEQTKQELEAKQKELDLFKENAKFRERNREQMHVSQILAFKESEDNLKKEKDEIEKSLKILRDKTANGTVSPEVKKQLEKLETDLDERTKQRDNLAALRERLSKELDEQRDANKARHEQEMYEHRINDRVKKVTEEWGKYSVTLLGQLPSPIESQVVTGSNWALIDHATDMAHRIIDAVAQLKSSQAHNFLDSEVTNDAN